MGFMIWYKIVFKEEKLASGGGVLSQAASALFLGTSLPLTVSNDVFSGKYALDADIVLTMLEGATADSFAITLINLPLDVAKALQEKQRNGMSQKQYLLVDIYLGYFDDDTSKSTAKQVMTGVVTFIKNTVNGSGLLETVVKGQELGGYKLRTKCKARVSSKKITADDIVKEILKDTGVGVADNSHLDIKQPFENYTLRANNTNKELNGLEALKTFADQISVPLVLRDNTLYIGPSVGREKTILLDQETNIVKLDQKQDSDQSDPCKPDPAPSYDLIVLGHPSLRVGQQAVLKLDTPTTGPLRINQLAHTFSTRSGYTCNILIVTAELGKIAKEQAGAHAIVSGFRDFMEGTQRLRQAIDVGQVKDYEAGNQQKHQVTLDYGQSPDATAVAPSVKTKVDQETQLFSKPINSPFAWRNCGLMVPIYPGMRALLAHNRGLVNDAVVAGFLWSDEPEHVYERPKNEQGDYWLCLPTETETDKDDPRKNRPKGKGVNDLIDKSGLRVIQAKGLHIFVGNNNLPDVGERPAVPDAQTIVIEHESGAKITIGTDGAVKIEAAKNKEISFTNGGVTLTLGSTSVEVK